MSTITLVASWTPKDVEILITMAALIFIGGPIVAAFLFALSRIAGGK